MCGISGFNWEDEGKAKEMVSSLAHRGPDSSGTFVTEGISLGHNRLSIIDLSSDANQPMFDNSRELVIVFNGEIYNFEEIKKELSGKYDFKTKSDTEVILAGYRTWGKNVVEKLNGMFAFAIWDKRDNSLFCARDHAGMKPFYYFWDGYKFIFSSEIPAILSHDVDRRLNRDAFNHYMRVLYVPEPMTMIENIYKLSPSHTLFLKNSTLSINEWGGEDVSQTKLSYEEVTTELRSKVLGAVKRHLVSDVPLGVYLSGGIDSSAVLSAMSQFSSDIKTFTIGFNENDPGVGSKFNDDFRLAKETASFFGTDHHSLVVSAKDVLDSLEDVIAHNSDPISNPTSAAMMLLARFAKTEVTVALTGNGGDEFFGGYERYRKAVAGKAYMKLPKFLRTITNLNSQISKLDYSEEIDLFARVFFEKDERLSQVISSSFFRDDSFTKKYFKERYFSLDIGDPANSFMNVDQRSWLPDFFFMLSDKMSMSASLEERMPLVDIEVMRFARSLPRSYKVDLFGTKKVLKDAFRKELPDFLFNQPKRGWFSPAAKWLRDGAFAEMAKNVLSPDYYDGTGAIFRWDTLQNMLEKHIKKEEYNLVTIWAIMTFQMWAKKFKIKL